MFGVKFIGVSSQKVTKETKYFVRNLGAKATVDVRPSLWACDACLLLSCLWPQMVVLPLLPKLLLFPLVNSRRPCRSKKRKALIIPRALFNRCERTAGLLQPFAFRDFF